jgi:hypothetical protein
VFDGTLLQVSQGIQQAEQSKPDGEAEEAVMQTSYKMSLEKKLDSGPKEAVTLREHMMNEVTDHWLTYNYLSHNETSFICFQTFSPSGRAGTVPYTYNYAQIIQMTVK